MRIEVHFYDKFQVTVNIATENPFGNFDPEFLIYAWFTLRLLHNHQHSPYSDAFAGLLTMTDRDPSLASFENNPTVLKGEDLLLAAVGAKFQKGETSAELRSAVSKFIREIHDPSSLSLTSSFAQLIDTSILSRIPTLIGYPGRPGDRQFIGEVPPPNFQYKGFGFLGYLLGKEMPYYAFHSLFAALRYFTRRYSADQLRLNRLACIADACGRSHMMKLIKPGSHLVIATYAVQWAERVWPTHEPQNQQ